MSRSCADDCLAVTLQTGERKGSYFDLDLPLSGTVSTYFTAPQGKSKDQMMSEKADKIILWMSDIYGPNFINNCLLMDWFASHGYLVISPDYFFGEQVEQLNKTPGFTLQDFIPKWVVKVEDEQGNAVPKTSLLLREWMPRVKEMFGKPTTKYGIVGYCFGAPYVLDYCTTQEVSAGSIVHPAMLDNDVVFHKLKQPLYASLAEQDSHFPPPRRRALEMALTALASPEAPDGDAHDDAKVGTGGYDYMIQVFSGVRHGFALRANLDIERNRWAKERSAESLKLWFDRFLS